MRQFQEQNAKVRTWAGRAYTDDELSRNEGLMDEEAARRLVARESPTLSVLAGRKGGPGCVETLRATVDARCVAGCALPRPEAPKELRPGLLDGTLAAQLMAIALKRGVLERFDASSGRWEVKLSATGEVKAIRWKLRQLRKLRKLSLTLGIDDELATIEEAAAAPSSPVPDIAPRPGGVLVAVPGGLITEESLNVFSVPEEGAEQAIVGPNSSFQVPIMKKLSPTEETNLGIGEVVVMDLGYPEALGQVSAYPTGNEEALRGVAHFHALEDAAYPDFEELDSMVRLWLSTELGERVAYYSAAEEEEPAFEEPMSPQGVKPSKPSAGPSTPRGRAPAGTKATTPRKNSYAALSQQLEQLMSVQVDIQQQLAAVSSRQDRMEAGEHPSSSAMRSKPLEAGRASRPVSSYLPGSAPTVVGRLASQVGPPPKAKPSAVRRPQLLQVEEPTQQGEEELLEEEARSDPGSPIAMAILQQRAMKHPFVMMSRMLNFSQQR
eukprot:Skav219109  [mRNA]  locus=scaffold1574:265740:271153:- [translate_table: standard]